MCVCVLGVCVCCPCVCVRIFPPFFFLLPCIFGGLRNHQQQTAHQGHGQCHPLRTAQSTSSRRRHRCCCCLGIVCAGYKARQRTRDSDSSSRLRGLSCHLALCSLTTAAAVASSQCRRRARQINLSQSWQWQQTRPVSQLAKHSGHSISQTRDGQRNLQLIYGANSIVCSVCCLRCLRCLLCLLGLLGFNLLAVTVKSVLLALCVCCCTVRVSM